MKVLVKRSSNWNYKEYKEFKNEKEMIEYGLNEHSEIIISKPDGLFIPEKYKNEVFDYGLEIYDDYRE